MQCLTAEEETEMLEIQTWILHFALFCLLSFYVVDRSMKGQGKSMDKYTGDEEFSMQLMYDGCYK